MNLAQTILERLKEHLALPWPKNVFGSGAQDSPWMIVGEAPGAEEDARGEPFVGQAGRLLESMLGSLGLSRDRDVFIANVLKCRPPGNRNPEPDEMRQCEPYLHRQIALLQPRGILVMGRFAAQALAARTGCDEMMLVCDLYDPALRLRSLDIAMDARNGGARPVAPA